MADTGTVLILKPSSLGDIVHTLPAVARFRRARPDWRVRWLVNDEFAPLLENNPAVDEVVRFPRREFRGVFAPQKVLRWLRQEWWTHDHRQRLRPDLALDFQGLLRSALLGRLSGTPVLHGMSDAREGATLFYHRVAPVPTGAVHAVRRYLALTDAATAESGDHGGAPVEFPLPPGEPWPEAGATPLPTSGYLVLHPFARGSGKSLSVAQVRAICEGLAPRPVLVVGRGTDRRLSELPANARNLLGRTTLPQLLWLLRRAAFILSVDSGPMHLAAAALPEARRLLSLHAWSDPRRVGPFPPEAWVWQAGSGLRRVSELSPDESPVVVSSSPLLQTEADVDAVCAHATQESGL